MTTESTATSQPPLIDPLNGSLPARPRKGTFSALSHRNFRLFFYGQMISVIGTWMQTTALQLLVVRLYPNPDDAARWLGAVGFVPLIPLLPFALVGGSLVDRFPRRTIVIITQTTMMLMAFVLFALTASGVVTIWHILGLLVLTGLANAIDIPARQTLIVEMVDSDGDDLAGAIALNSSIFNLGRAIGPAIAGLIVAAIGEADAFLINGISFLAVLLWLWLMRLPPRVIEDRQARLGQHLVEGLRYIRGQHTILVLFSMIGIVAFLAMPFTQLLPLFATYTLADSATPLTNLVCSRIACETPEALTFGLLNGVFGLGALVSALRVSVWSSKRSRGLMLTIGNIGFPLALLLFALSRSIWLSLALLFLVGMGWVLQTSLTNTMLQLTSPDNLRGRVMSVYAMLFQGGWRVGSMGSGFLASLLGAPVAVGLGAVLALAYGAFAALRWPKIRRLD